MGPWFIRNSIVFGTLLSPGGSRALWVQTYNQTFAYPADQLTMQNWLRSGWPSILEARRMALGWNLQTAWAVQGGIFLLPLILAGGWHHRKDSRILIGFTAWILTFFMMTLVFPFAGARGGLLHSGAAIQPLWWALAPVGLEMFVQWGGKVRGWQVDRARVVFLVGMVAIAAILSAAIFLGRVTSQPAWGAETAKYAHIESFLQEQNASTDDIVMVGNPPGYYIASGRSAIAVPDGDLSTVFEVARRYKARYLVLEKDGMPTGLEYVYQNAVALSSIRYLGEVEGDRIFEIP
jgi:hypothetical protein